jgi:putative phosphoesterase
MKQNNDRHLIGVISDTHGLLRPEAIAALAGVDSIIHAGDVARLEIIAALEGIAPVTVVRGNVDVSAWGLTLPMFRTIGIGSKRIQVLHDISMLGDFPAKEIDVVITGHSHRPSVVRRDGILYLNPGSAGPRRFSLPITLAMLTIDGEEIDARIVELVAE